MIDLVRDFPEQIRKALEIGKAAQFTATYPAGIKNIVVCGLGGSGIGGDLLKELMKDTLPVPVVVCKGYALPAFVDAQTLLILCSYSGNTEEAIANAQEAIAKGFHPVCITAGGKLEQIARANHFDLVLIPSGFPPRACLGYSSIQLFFVLKHYQLISDSFIQDFMRVADFLESQQEEIKKASYELATLVKKKVVILYAEDKYESTALRLKQQINENSKMHCWYNVFPEVNHNELVGWKERNENLALLFFRTADENPRNTLRMEFTKKAIQEVSSQVYELVAKGSDSMERHFYFIHFGDWLSCYLAQQLEYDAVEVTILTNLKNHLSSIQ
ncbi:MAG: bifunctional phosphoglucose/phosphomannose isomerase [Bacteroidetes bacterium]|nr:bifunctional phosphoglucose/phosphomannose isomerase [Bacteroidota bacterium]